MLTTTLRIPEDLHDLGVSIAARQGLSFSEFVRQAVAVRIAWIEAAEAVANGADPKQIQDSRWVCELLMDARTTLGETPPPAPRSDA